MPDLGYEDEPVEHVKIAMTTFAFRNQEVIGLLKERGQIIKQEKWAKLPKIDQKINDYKNENLEDMTTPCSVFMTFENEEGVNRALNYDQAVTSDENLKHLETWLDRHTIEIQ